MSPHGRRALDFVHWFQNARPHARRGLKSENRGVDRGFEAAVDRQIGAVDPPRAVRAKKEDRGRDIGRRARAADAGDVVIDASIAEDLAKFPENRVVTGPGLTALTRNPRFLHKG